MVVQTVVFSCNSSFIYFLNILIYFNRLDLQVIFWFEFWQGTLRGWVLGRRFWFT